MGRITIEDLRISAVIGTLPEERLAPQTLWVTIEVEADTVTPAAADQLDHALDYRVLADAVRELAVDGRFRLVETLAERAAELLQSRFPVGRTAVIVRKPGAIRDAAAVRIRVVRERPEEDT